MLYLQPTNILIDANFRAKLSDFGLSKVMEVDQSHVSSEVRGTFGYVDPEYRKNHHVNASGDVYRFGVVLLQLLSGQRVINLDSKRTMSLNKVVRDNILSINSILSVSLKVLFPNTCLHYLTCISLVLRLDSSQEVVI